jgi:2-keto-4-pentenoate hydratase/2-oxohepta-3-ene-1,7-dioic acid hydratase in catechol pathway
MRFVTFAERGADRLGLLRGEDVIVDLATLYALAASGPACPLDMLALIRDADRHVPLIRGWLDGKAARAEAARPVKDVELRAPIPRPPKNVFCVGRNYLDHLKEGDRAQGRVTAMPPAPEFFSKPPTSVVGPRAPIRNPVALTSQLDYEIELAVIIGRAGRDIPRENALGHVFGFSIVNDVTARDLQRLHGQWFKGKSLDGACPFGPCILHATAWSGEPFTLELSVNGERRQYGTTSDMLYGIDAIIEILSRGLTLEPGDIIATGTPSGVGYAMQPPSFLKNGDVVTATINGIGTLRNEVVAV